MSQIQKSFVLENEEQTKTLAKILREYLRAGDIVFLKGDLGAGKTTLVRAFIQAQMGDDFEVPSPTFSLFNLYDDLNPQVLHADMYRLDEPDDVYELGFDDYLSDHIFFIEWPEMMPEDYLHANLILTLTLDHERETHNLSSSGPLGIEIEGALERAGFKS